MSYEQEEPLLVDPTAVSSTASQQHQQEQEMLSSYSVPKPPMSTQQSTVASETEAEPNVAPQEQPRTLWMGDLDTWLDESAIVDLWWQILRKKVNVKVIKPKNPKPESPYMGLTHSGYCFVEFETYDDAQQALTLNGQLLPDIAMPSQRHFPNNPDNQKKYFRLNWASGATLSAPIVHSPEYSLFVGDLSASTTEAHLLSFFQKSFPNSIKTVRVMTDPVSGKSRCFGFVRFTDDAERRRALVEMNGAWFGGRPLRVALATPRNASMPSRSPKPDFRNNDLAATTPYLDQQQDYMYMGPGPNAPVHGAPPGPPGSSGYYYTSPMMGDKSSSDLGYGIPQSMSSQGQAYTDPANTTVFVGGLSSDVSEQTLLTLFMPFGVIQQIKIPQGKNCGFLKYSTREEAEEAISAMEGFIIGGNRVRLGWGRVSPNNKKYHHQRQQFAHVAQMQAAAAMSMGMDPASAYAAAAAAAAGYPPPPPPPQNTIPGSSPGYPPVPMGIPQMHPMGAPSYDVPEHGVNGEEQEYTSADTTTTQGGSEGHQESSESGYFNPDNLTSTFDKLNIDAPAAAGTPPTTASSKNDKPSNREQPT
ncbi:hypothetical protein FT663_04667 [Candidozyma haemuli var. vulneris]|uniref:RRM domain-containing protein n=1 Tax=Candidozyma haemuli TaxID=45357 RepID=A0A2V1B1G6_9ASCO|nr:hypothetical protein CXQ85_003913 [[Candida] haemuloni]KAF3986940.1 hypothetical protein FT663_04667 [[Candida] haemuloni var. vulneris]KAF3989110.1 hypothetical protein FT662_03006 [[Candida] haemuloni var. vulneris]PVH23623.1 hypothetical protein CXQ85_003913 [[Candida] haemuloni]